MAAKTWVGRFCVANGRAEEEGPWLRSLIRQRQDDEPDELYVLVEPATPSSADYTSQLVDVIAQLYRRDALSLTGALTRSLRAAHEHLVDWNSKSLPEHRIAAGATCIALSGGDAYLAQMGPSLAYVRSHDGRFRRIEPAETDFEHALGTADEFGAHLTRVVLEPGDLLVVASSALDGIAPADHVERMMSRDPDDVLPEFYLLCKDTPDMALVLLSRYEEPLDTPPGFLTNNDSGAAEASPSEEPLADAVSSNRVEIARAESGDPARASVGVMSPPLPLEPGRSIKQQVDEIKESAAPLAPPPVRLRGEGSGIRYRRSTGPIALPQLRIPRLAVFAALAIALLGLIAYWQLPGDVQESREARFVTLVAGAREANARAQATSDTGLKRQLLSDARANLDDAAKIHDDSPEVQTLQADVAAALNLLNAVFEVRDATVVADLAQLVTGDLGATQIVLGGDSTYVLDAEGSRVLRVLLDGQPPITIYERGRAVNLVTASQPGSIEWSPATNSLLILDDQRQAYTYVPDGGVLPMAVRDSASLGSMDGIATAAGNLYVLDRAENQVWRYLPSQGGYDSERVALLDQADLAGALEIAVAESVYVLDATEGIRRFDNRAEVEFPLSGIDRPLASPASISVLPGSGRIVVADAGNKRVVVVSNDGRFLRQITSPSFTDLRAVAVDEGAGIMYVLNGDTVVRATFPP
jgi:hypothetical protein